MDINYTYLKKRKNFGRQPMFCEVASHIIDSIPSNPSVQKQFILRNPVHKEAQVGQTQSECEVNTSRIISVNQGIRHAEGGWPKDVHYFDEEAVARHRRRIERDDGYINAVLNTYHAFEYNIKQNNAIEMYQMYFNDWPAENPVEKYEVLTKNIYRDPNGLLRPVACIDWTIEEDTKLAIAYSDKRYPLNGRSNNSYPEAYVFALENPNDALYTLEPPCYCWQVACSPAHSSIITGGLENGRLCVFDVRENRKPIAMTPFHLAHRDPVTSVLYIQSRMNTEFFSGSTDGLCMWWDVRNLSQPTDTMIIAVKVPPGVETDLSHAEPVSVLQFDRAFPTRFLCGTDTGLIINVNRKGKTIAERMSAVFRAHYGPVKAVHRSPLTSKMFISCGDWSVHIWSDEVTVSPIITGTTNDHPITDVCWAPNRISAYMTISSDGKFHFWDLLRRYKTPIVTYPVCNKRLLKMKVNENGRFVAIGDNHGQTYLITLSDSMNLPGGKDKQIMLQAYEREFHRERILENRIKEIRLRLKADEEGGDMPVTEVQNEDELCKIAEDEYKRIVHDEMSKKGMPVKTKSETMRKR